MLYIAIMVTVMKFQRNIWENIVHCCIHKNIFKGLYFVTFMALLDRVIKNWTSIQQGTNIHERLLNKPYVNDVTLRGQKSPLKCC